MEIKKRYIVITFFTLKIIDYSFDKKEELKIMYDLLYNGEYIAFFEELTKFTIKIFEYAVTIAL